MEHQDWETYIIHCKDTKKEKKDKIKSKRNYNKYLEKRAL